MSQQLLDEFLGEVRGITRAATGRNFTESRSSLQGLIADLRRQVRADSFQIMAYRDALAKCGNAADPRLAKYEQAIKKLCSPWGVPTGGGAFVYLPILAQEGEIAGGALGRREGRHDPA